MKLKSVSGLSVLAFMVAAGAAQAGVTFYSFGTGAAALPLVTNFSGDTVNTAPSALPSGYSWSGDAVVLDTTSGNGAEPAIGNGVYGTGNYLSIEGGQSETLTISKAGIKEISLYIGSLDGYNNLDFTFMSPTGPISYAGTALGLVSGANDGAQTAADTNGMFYFTFAQPVTSISFASTTNSFEIASISAAVPEPTAWAMTLVGVGMVGASLRMGRRKNGAFAANRSPDRRTTLFQS